MGSFDEAWTAVAKPRSGEAVSSELRSLLHAVYLQSLSHPLNAVVFKRTLEDLLQFLAGKGRTNANCWAVDLFLGIGEGWEKDWADQDLPEGFHDVLALMSEALHDTVRAQDVAENFGCLPEQILERVKQLPDV